jgi:hypothetical protein
MHRISRSIASVCAATILLVCATASAAPLYAAAAAAAERAYADLADQIAQARQDNLRGFRADGVRNEVRAQTTAFTEAMTGLDRELASLRQNPQKNLDLIAELEKAKDRSEDARSRLRTLNSLMSQGDEVMLNAVRSGVMERALRSVAEAMGGAARTIESAHRELDVSEGEQPGYVEIRRLQVEQGKIKFFMNSYVAGRGLTEVEIKLGGRYPVRKLPIVIRASVIDDQKQRLLNLEQEHVVGRSQSVVFDPVVDFSPGHRFQYTGLPGTSIWTAEETYAWEPSPGGTAEAVRRLQQESSDRATVPATGDLVLIHPARVPAQNLTFHVTGTTVRWKRESILNNRAQRGEMVPGNNEARATIVLSLFSD